MTRFSRSPSSKNLEYPSVHLSPRTFSNAFSRGYFSHSTSPPPFKWILSFRHSPAPPRTIHPRIRDDSLLESSRLSSHLFLFCLPTPPFPPPSRFFIFPVFFPRKHFLPNLLLASSFPPQYLFPSCFWASTILFLLLNLAQDAFLKPSPRRVIVVSSYPQPRANL